VLVREVQANKPAWPSVSWQGELFRSGVVADAPIIVVEMGAE
jgi:hypothetical protein